MTSKITGVVEGILESVPSIIIQTFNNIENDAWSLIAILSITASIAGVLYTILKLVFLCDKYAKIAQWVEDEIPHNDDGEAAGIEVAQRNS
jgi:hypothetical protein|mmetsp:Transcript_17092/g.2826  ORF Transcript_17092/g.2826 Transcript_17092/m.2826 type:complete len:91 (-) Transcript_17092:23-295(-)